MDFETDSRGRLHRVPPRLTIGGIDRILKPSPLITVDGRIVRDVIDGGCGYVVIECDGSVSRVP